MGFPDSVLLPTNGETVIADLRPKTTSPIALAIGRSGVLSLLLRPRLCSSGVELS